MTIDPEKRPSAEDLLLNDEFLLKNAKNKSILSELVQDSLDEIEKYRINQ